MKPPTLDYVLQLEDEVEELRAKLKVTENELAATTQDRDRWKKHAAAVWCQAYLKVL